MIKHSYSEPPNVSNLTALYGEQHHLFDTAYNLPSTTATTTATQATPATTSPTSVIINPTAAHKSSPVPLELLEKLRWVTLGYHYDWTNREYYRHHFTPIPNDLYELTQKVSYIYDVSGMLWCVCVCVCGGCVGVWVIFFLKDWKRGAQTHQT